MIAPLVMVKPPMRLELKEFMGYLKGEYEDMKKNGKWLYNNDKNNNNNPLMIVINGTPIGVESDGEEDDDVDFKE